MLKIESLIASEPSSLDGNLFFKKNDTTGWVCNAVRDILFHLGVMDNFLHAGVEDHNTA